MKIRRRFHKEDFKEWLKWRDAGMELEHIAERAGVRYDYVSRKIIEMEEDAAIEKLLKEAQP